MVARMLCRSLSWMGWVGLPTAAGTRGVWAAAGVVGVTVGEVAEGAAGVTGVVGAWAELILVVPEPEEGVTAADWLRELDMGRREGGIHER